jgi:DNA modification methylase
MSLRTKILELLNGSQKMTMQEIYQKFPDVAKTTIRGRVYDNLGKGIERIGKGIYISSEAIVEKGNSLIIIDRMIDQGDLFDFVFLDIPYNSAGQNGGNRNLFACDKISHEEFGIFLNKTEKLLKTDKSPLVFMFTSGKSSKTEHDLYLSKFTETGFIQCQRKGTYTKLWKNGNRMNMGKYLMPVEYIYVFTKSGTVDDINSWVLDFEMTPDFDYPTSKPYNMIKKIVEQATKIGDWVFDAFGGSGKTLRACLELKRMCHTIDISENSFNNHILPLLTTTKLNLL